AWLTISSQRFSPRTSCSTKLAVPPADAISFSMALPSVALLSVSRTDAPCWANKRAVAAPMPEAPPVTTATLPKSLLPGSMVVSSFPLLFWPVCKGVTYERDFEAPSRRSGHSGFLAEILRRCLAVGRCRWCRPPLRKRRPLARRAGFHVADRNRDW